MRLNARSSFVHTVALGCVLSPLTVIAATNDTKPPASVAPAAKQPSLADAAAARKAAQVAMNAAIANLTKEYQLYAKDNKANKLRETSNYFTENKTTDLTDENIFVAMNAKINPDPAADSYIKWQLMSGLSEKLDMAKALQPLVYAYMSAAPPIHRPGMAAAEKQELDGLIRNLKAAPGADTLNAINDKLKVPVDAWMARDEVIITYRDALYAKLPKAAVQTFIARLDDLHKRLEAGITLEPLAEKWRLEAAAWVKTNPQPHDAGMLADAVLKVINEMGGIPKKPAASAGGTGEVFASVTTPGNGGDNASAPVLLAAGAMKNYPTNPANSNNPNYPTYPGQQGMTKEFPPKFYEQVEFDTKTNKLMWSNVAGKFIKKEILVELYQDLRDASKAAPGAAPAANNAKDMNMKPTK